MTQRCHHEIHIVASRIGWHSNSWLSTMAVLLWSAPRVSPVLIINGAKDISLSGTFSGSKIPPTVIHGRIGLSDL